MGKKSLRKNLITLPSGSTKQTLGTTRERFVWSTPVPAVYSPDETAFIVDTHVLSFRK